MPSNTIQILPSNSIQNLGSPHYIQNIQDVMTTPGEAEKWMSLMERGAPTTKSLVIKNQKIAEPSNDEKSSQELGLEWITPVKNRQHTSNTNNDLSEAPFEKLKPHIHSQSPTKVNLICESANKTKEASRVLAKKWTAPVYNPMFTSAYSGYDKSAINFAQVY